MDTAKMKGEEDVVVIGDDDDIEKMKGEEDVVVIGDDDDIDTGCLVGDLKKKTVLDKDAEYWRTFFKIYNNRCTEEIEAAGYTRLEDDTTTLDTGRPFEWLNIPGPEEKAPPEEEEDYEKYFTKPCPIPNAPFVHDGGVYIV